MDDQELFESTLSNEPAETEAPAQVEAELKPDDGQPRDEQGKFAPKEAAESEPTGKDEAHIPSWRLREQTERAEAAERRLQQMQSDWQRQFYELRQHIPTKPAEPPKSIYDVDDPSAFIADQTRNVVDPVKSEIGQLREFFSRKEAMREFGEEKVNAAYQAIAHGMQSRDPEVVATYNRAMHSMDPYGEIVKWHQQKTVYSQIGSDPNAWFEKQLEERLSKDPAFQAKLIERAQQQARSPSGAPTSVVRLPPSISRVGAASAGGLSDNLSDTELFDAATSMRR